jgi:hypothetical protein
LSVHLIGEGGQKSKKIESITNCWINISYPKLPSMPPISITIKSKIARDQPFNVQTAIRMIEESLVDFLKDKSAEKRLLYELAATATESYNSADRSRRNRSRRNRGRQSRREYSRSDKVSTSNNPDAKSSKDELKSLRC